MPILNQLAPSQSRVKKEAEHRVDVDVMSTFYFGCDFPRFVERVVKAMWIPVGNVDCKKSILIL
ncbi:hypothetical protein PR048_027315 [Dryococelus australis]|uniref:Uncharacterized protein n=1 Tax=Dryococelus australis TaxID=614101 RepID=A0ABQ9GF47_9NEOP|nr:hypothetical protein PR048_027315 [Dryococelus australis]